MCIILFKICSTYLQPRLSLQENTKTQKWRPDLLGVYNNTLPYTRKASYTVVLYIILSLSFFLFRPPSSSSKSRTTQRIHPSQSPILSTTFSTPHSPPHHLAQAWPVLLLRHTRQGRNPFPNEEAIGSSRHRRILIGRLRRLANWRSGLCACALSPIVCPHGVPVLAGTGGTDKEISRISAPGESRVSRDYQFGFGGLSFPFGLHIASHFMRDVSACLPCVYFLSRLPIISASFSPTLTLTSFVSIPSCLCSPESKFQIFESCVSQFSSLHFISFSLFLLSSSLHSFFIHRF